MPLPSRFNESGAGTSLRGWLHLFLRYPSPRLIAAALVVCAAVRLMLGNFHHSDVIVAIAFIVAQPFTEWMLHVTVLHFRPRRAGRRTLDLYIARKHRAHHADPVDIRLSFVQMPALIGLLVIFFAGVALGFRDIRLIFTAATTGYTLLLVYEWMHYLIHSTYVPRHALYRTIWRSHRLHHYKNEHYWFGVTNPIGDIVLRTYPGKTSVPTSPTARTLGVSEV